MTAKTSLDTPSARPSPAEGARNSGRPLIAWPMALIALTLGLLLMANTVSAWGRRDNHDVEEFKEHAEFFVGRMLKRLEATEEQRDRIQTIVAGTVDQLAAARLDREGLREEISELLTAESIDRDALESLRASHLARADEMSRIVSVSLADVMDTLTVEQRKRLEEKMSRHHGRHGWH